MNSRIGSLRKESKIVRCVKAPIRILARAREFYVNSMIGCSGKVGYGSAMGSQFSTLPRSFSVNSTASDEDFRELVRVSSTKIDPHEFIRFKKSPHVVPRSHTVTIGRIDEDKSCEFGANDVDLTQDVYPRSRSYQVLRRGKMV